MKSSLGDVDGLYARYLIDELVNMLAGSALPADARQKLDERVLARIKDSTDTNDRMIVGALRGYPA